MTSELVKFLEWDSEFFGVRIARILPKSLKKTQLKIIDSWCAKNNIDCLYFLTNAHDSEPIHLAESNGFKLMDIRCTLTYDFPKQDTPLPLSNRIRPATPEDIQDLKLIASSSHHNSRFYIDNNFTEQQCNKLFETWIEKSCSGYADIVLVATNDHLPVGYISCKIDEHKKGEIGLLAVADAHRRQGFGYDILRTALSWFHDNGVNTVEVSTQNSNIKALRHYQKSGFTVSSVGLWFHQWSKQHHT